MAHYKKGTPEYKAYKQGKKNKQQHPLGPVGSLIKGGLADLLISQVMNDGKKK